MRLSCGVVPIRKHHGIWQFLILRCYKNWDFPKGMKEENEDPLTTARREFSEETGVADIQINSSETFIETESYSNGKVARYYLGIMKEGEQIKILPNPVTGIMEHHEYRWVNAEDADLLLVPRLKKILNWAVKNLPE